MPLGLGSALWAAVVPVAKVNLLPNPSYEFGDYNTVAVSGGVQILGTSSAFQQFGAWSLLCVPNTAGTSGASVGTWQSGNGTAYTASSYVRGAVGQNYTMCVQDQSSLAIIGSTTFDGGGTWARYSMSYTETGDTTRKLTIRKTSGAGVGSYWIDGSQVEVGSITTYIDGDVPGCSWTNAPHNSPSYRSDQVRSGGTVIALADLGLQVDQMIGAGVPSIENSYQSYAVIDGAQYQRTRVATRQLTLTARPIVGTSLADFHITRRTLFDVLKPDEVTPQQPVRFVYVGGQGTQQIDAFYDHGLELGNMDGPIAEDIAVTFIATDPYWYAPTQQGTSLSPQVSMGSTNFVASRDPQGRWGTLGVAGTSVSSFVNKIIIGTAQEIFVSGSFQTAGGTTSGAIAVYTPSTNRWGTLSSGTVAPMVRTMALSPNGTLYFGGAFAAYGGTNSGSLGYYAGGFYGSFTGVPTGGQVWGMTLNNTGTLFFSGQFTQVKGTTSPSLALWNGAAFGSLVGQAGGTINGPVYALTIGLDQSLYFGGGFGSAGGTAILNIGKWKNGAFGSMGSGVGTANNAALFVDALATMQDGRIALAGNFDIAGGVNTQSIAIWNGAGYSSPASGIGSANNTNYAYALAVGTDNQLYCTGAFTAAQAGSVVLPDGAARYVGGAWVPFDVDLPPLLGGGTAQVATVLLHPSGTMYIGGNFAGIGTAASVAQVVNYGRAQAYPTLRLRNLSASGTARVFQLLNTTTGAGIYFSLVLLPSEIATLTLTPTQRSFQSSFRSNIFGAILPGSNLAAWSLLPGVNFVSFFSDNTSLEASLFWTPKGWGADSGTVY